MSSPTSADLVLVGAGHAHVQLLRRFMMAPMSGVRLTLIVDRPDAVYSGMVPGFVAGDYESHELEIDAVPLARRAKARVVLARATRIDAVARRVEVEGRPSVAYDVASLNIGATVAGLDVPGVREFALATRPIRSFVDALDEQLSFAEGARSPRIVVVGGGAAGVELAMTLRARIPHSEMTLVTSTARLMPADSARVDARLRRELAQRAIGVRLGSRVIAVEHDRVRFADGEHPADRVVWATGAAAHSLARDSGLECDDRGFTRVDESLQVIGADALFAVGDCASLPFAPWVRKAGVFAVREGPILDYNVRAFLRGRRLRRYRPQRDFLTLIHLGDRKALAAKWGLCQTGSHMWRLKDRIDRRFMQRFQVLAADGSDACEFPSPESMGMAEMACGGCAAKLGQTPLARALERLPEALPDSSVRVGLAAPDDAAWIDLPRGDSLLATVDAFRAFADDPFLVGRAATVNAVSDVLAKGGTPRHAMALVTVPEGDPVRAEESVFQVVSGIRAALDPLGVSLIGGHTTLGSEVFVGLAVTGEPPDVPLLLSGAREGHVLVLTKALGTGVILAADMQGRAPGRIVERSYGSMLRANSDAARVATVEAASAATDVSGFGCAGHLAELLRASGVSARIELGSVPAMPGALSLLASGLRSTFHAQNSEGRRGIVGGDADPVRFELLFDPQTCGGLLLAFPSKNVDAAIASLRESGDVEAAKIGTVTRAREDGAIFEVV